MYTISHLASGYPGSFKSTQNVHIAQQGFFRVGGCVGVCGGLGLVRLVRPIISFVANQFGEYRCFTYVEKPSFSKSLVN